MNWMAYVLLALSLIAVIVMVRHLWRGINFLRKLTPLDFWAVVLAFGIVGLVAGCASTSTIREFDRDTGKMTKETITKESVVQQVIASTKNKSVFLFREDYTVGIKAEPSEKMFSLEAVYHHDNNGVASVLPEHNNAATLNAIATCLAVMKRTDSVSITANGISSGSGSSSVTSSGASGSSTNTTTTTGSTSATSMAAEATNTTVDTGVTSK